MKTKIIKFRDKISIKHPFIINVIYFICVLLLFIYIAILPWLFESLVCSTICEKITNTSSIQDKNMYAQKIVVKRKRTNIYQYFFIVDEKEIEVLPSIYFDYEIGDDFTYYTYSMGNIEYISAQNFTFICTFIVTCVSTPIFYFICFFYLLVIKKKRKKRML